MLALTLNLFLREPARVPMSDKAGTAEWTHPFATQPDLANIDKSAPKRIYSWNVNGLNSVWKKGALQKFVKKEDPDTLILQETKLFPH